MHNTVFCSHAYNIESSHAYNIESLLEISICFIKNIAAEVNNITCTENILQEGIDLCG